MDWILILRTLCVVIFVAILWALYKRHVLLKRFSKIPGITGIPFIGIVANLMTMPQEEHLNWFMQQSFKYKDGIFKTEIGSYMPVHIRKAEHMQTILSSTMNNKKSLVYDAFVSWLGRSLFTAAEPEWSYQKKLIMPAFHSTIIEKFAVVMEEKSKILVNRIENELQKHPKQPIDVISFINDFTLDTICETAMGINLHAQENTQNEYIKAVRVATDSIRERVTHPWLESEWIFQLTSTGRKYYSSVKTMHKFTTDVIRKRKVTRKTDSIKNKDELTARKRKAFLDHLLDLNEKEESPMSDEKLREHVDTFMFAGHDTLASSLSWALLCLGTEAEVQEELYKELDDVLVNWEGSMSFELASQLKYLERVIKESMRLYPVAGLLFRTLLEDVQLGKYVIPKDTIVTFNFHGLHRDPEHWPDPEKFDPDRFLPQNSKDRHHYAYLPFSGGPRSCIGQKYAILAQKIALITILQKWKVKSVLERQDIKMYNSITLKPVNGIFLYFVPRE